MSDLVEVTPLTASWPARTWSPGEKVTAGMMNGVRDQLNELHSGVTGGVGSNIAFINKANVFVQPQLIQYGTPRIGMVDLAWTVDARRFDWTVSGGVLYTQALTDVGGYQLNLNTVDRGGNFWTAGGITSSLGVVASGDVKTASRVIVGPIGSANAAALRYEGVDILGVVTGDNARYAGVQARWVKGNAPGNQFADLTLTGATNFAAGLNVTAGGASITGTLVVNAITINVSGLTVTAGGAAVTGNITCSGNIHNLAGYVYPGELNTAGAYQGSWFLASNSSYGLYINTGLYVVGNVWCANVFGTGQVQGVGYACRSGTSGGFSGSSFNWWWDGNVHCYIDASYIGYIGFLSDARMKHDFTPLVGSLDKIRQMKPGSFFFYRDVEYRPHLGLLAQDVMEVAPELVRKVDMATDRTPDGYYQINYTEMIPMLVAAIQELEQKVDRLQKEH